MRTTLVAIFETLLVTLVICAIVMVAVVSAGYILEYLGIL